MKKSKKIMLRIIPIVLVLMVIVTANVFATGKSSSPISPNLGSSSTNIPTVSNTANKIWGTVTLILQIAAVAAVVFAGVRYMFASADTKADIKKQMVILVIGAVLVFGATTVINFIVTVTNEVL